MSELTIRPVRVWLFGTLCLLLAVVSFVYQAFTPSDGARISKSPQAWSSQGIFLHTYTEASGLQDHDLLVAVNREPIQYLVDRLFQPNFPDWEWKKGQMIEYTVIREGESLDIPIRLSYQPLVPILLAHWGVLIYAVASQLLAVFVFLRRPKDPGAVGVFIWGMTSSHFYVWAIYRQVPDILNGYGFWLFSLIASFLWLSNWASGVQLALTFPRPLPSVVKRRQWLFIPYLSAYLFWLAFIVFSRNYTGNTMQWIATWGQGESLAAMLLFLPMVFILLYQYRSDRSLSSRKKMRLVIFSALACGSLTFAAYLLPPFLGLPSLDANFIGVILVLIPASMAIAILRYQLFDIDLIIRRTLIYSSLTFSLIFIYFATVVAFQQALRSLGGEATNSQAAVVLSTLVTAALFNPFRKRIQGFIDRRFYRRRYDAAQTLEAFATQLRDEVDIEQLSRHLLLVVDEAIQPESASLWLEKVVSKPERQDT